MAEKLHFQNKIFEEPDKMEEWLKITLCVSLFATFRDFRPVDSFYTSYLTSPAVNFTAEQVTEDIYPVNSYATTSLIIIMFLVTDFVLYKPIVMLDALSSIVMFLLVLEPVTLFKTKLSMVFLSLTSASELAYMSYAYAKIRDRKLYQKMTGIVRGSNLLGKCLSSTFAQIAVSILHFEYELLVYISLLGSIVAFAISFFFPPVNVSIYFHPESPKTTKPKVNYSTFQNQCHKYFERTLASYSTTVSSNAFTLSQDGIVHSYDLGPCLVEKSPKPVRVVFDQLYSELREAYTNPYLLKYGIWFAFATGVYFQVLTYNDVLYLKLNELNPVNNKLYNGGVDALAFITGALSSYFIGFVKVDWESKSNLFFFVGSILSCITLCVCYVTTSLNLVYIMYIIFCFVFQSMNVVARSETAKHLKHDGFAFIFGFAFFISLVVSSVITYLFVQGTIIVIPVNEQFLIYGLINGGLAIWFFFKCVKKKFTVK